MSLWTLLQRRMDQSSVPVAPACPPDEAAAPAPRHDSTNRRSATPAKSPERRPKSPERFLHTPQSTVSSFLRRAREPERKARTPVRHARTPVRHRSESRESRSRSPLSRSSSVESPARDESPINFAAAMDPESKRDISDDEGDDGDSKKKLNTRSSDRLCPRLKDHSNSTLRRLSERPGPLCWTWVIRKLPTESHG